MIPLLLTEHHPYRKTKPLLNSQLNSIYTMSSEQLPPEVQEKVKKLYQLQQKAENVAIQKQNSSSRLDRIKEAIDELEESDQKTGVYRNYGDIIIEKEGPSEVIDELEEEKEDLELRTKTLEKQEEKIRNKLQELQQELQQTIERKSGKQGAH